MNLQIHNHRKNIKGVQPAKLEALYPGMIVTFKYPSKNDVNPLILLLYSEHYKSKKGLLHGINLNYLLESEVQRLFCTCELLYKGASVYSKEPITRKIQSQMSDYDDTMPKRNLLKENFTRIMLPTYKEKASDTGQPLGFSEAKRRMKMLYEKVIKRLLSKKQIYRTYSPEKLKTLKVVQYQLGGWSQPGVEKKEDKEDK